MPGEEVGVEVGSFECEEELLWFDFSAVGGYSAGGVEQLVDFLYCFHVAKLRGVLLSCCLCEVEDLCEKCFGWRSVGADLSMMKYK